MGSIAEAHIGNYLSGRWGLPVSNRQFPKTSRASIADNRFLIVEVVSTKTNRSLGTRLIVCEQNETTYWVWASAKVTGIAKAVCKPVSTEMTLNEALTTLGRKPYAADKGNSMNERNSMATRTGFSSYVAQPNTSESDLQPMVGHIVDFYQHGQQITIKIMAEAPDDAIDRARRMSDAAIARHRI
jgi:hypothetical protein